MRVWETVRRIGPWLALAGGLWGAQGCTSLMARAKNPAHGVLLYVVDRVEDGLEMIDGGLTFSKKPGFALYGHFASLTPIGVGHFDGYFLGVGGGQLGLTRHYLSGVGLGVWGYEEIGWGDYDVEDLATLQSQGVGPLGIVLPPYQRPGSVPS